MCAQILFLGHQRCLQNPLKKLLMALFERLLHGGRRIYGSEASMLIHVRANVAERSKVG
jgi:hypothetical protein